MSTAPRPGRLVVVVGTATEVGKTWVTAHVAAALQAEDLRVSARKPAQSFEPGDVEREGTDAQVLAGATAEAPDTVCPRHRWYEAPMAPPMAATSLGRPPFVLADLVAELSWSAGTDVGFVETAGGVRSPLSSDGDAVGLIRALAPDAVVVVADAGLGTINAVRLTVEAVHTAHDRSTIVHLNRFDPAAPLHRRNHEWLTDRDGFTVTTTLGTLARALSVSRTDRRQPKAQPLERDNR